MVISSKCYPLIGLCNTAFYNANADNINTNTANAFYKQKNAESNVNYYNQLFNDHAFYIDFRMH